MRVNAYFFPASRADLTWMSLLSMTGRILTYLVKAFPPYAPSPASVCCSDNILAF